jgi:hypothetical protein
MKKSTMLKFGTFAMAFLATIASAQVNNQYAISGTPLYQQALGIVQTGAVSGAVTISNTSSILELYLIPLFEIGVVIAIAQKIGILDWLFKK